MQNIKLDISKNLLVPKLFAKQDNVGQKFTVTVLDNGTAYNIPEDAKISVWYSGASGEGNYSQIDGRSAFAIESNTITVELIPQMLRCAGEAKLCLVLILADGSQVGLWNIPYYVENIPGAGSEAAIQYYSALLELINGIKDGETPYIGENGNWWIGETDTGVSAGGTGSGLPEVTTEDNGKAAVVMNGQWAAMKVSVPDDAHINSLIDAKLGVIENGTY